MIFRTPRQDSIKTRIEVGLVFDMLLLTQGKVGRWASSFRQRHMVSGWALGWDCGSTPGLQVQEFRLEPDKDTEEEHRAGIEQGVGDRDSRSCLFLETWVIFHKSQIPFNCGLFRKSSWSGNYRETSVHNLLPCHMSGRKWWVCFMDRCSWRLPLAGLGEALAAPVSICVGPSSRTPVPVFLQG